MKVKLVGKPVFYFSISLELLRLLMKTSKLHYDGECQRASVAAGAPLRPGSTVQVRENGILVQWRNRFTENDACDTEEVRATWDQLDLITKICECAKYLDDKAEQEKVMVFGLQIGRILRISGDLAKIWETEIVI